MEPTSAPTAPGPIPATPAAMPASMGEHMLAQLQSDGPDATPEVLRYVAMIDGALDGVSRAVSELNERLAHVLKDSDPHPMPGSSLEPPQTALGQRLDPIYREAVELERVIHGIRIRLAV